MGVQSLWSTVKHFNFFVLQKFLNMGVNQSKGSVDITSTPNKGPAPEVNGKKADEKIIDEKTKVNGDANGDAKKEEIIEEKPEKEVEAEKSAETEETKEADETIDEAEKSTTSEKKKTSTKDKIKKRLSIRTINFLKRKKKEDGNESKTEEKEAEYKPVVMETQPTLMLTGPMTTYNAGSTAPPYTNSTSGNSFASSQPGGFPTGPGYSM